MTEENYNYRTSQSLLRNQLPGNGKLKIPVIPKFEAKPGDFDNLLLIGFDKMHLQDMKHLNRMVKEDAFFTRTKIRKLALGASLRIFFCCSML
ncbi:MAG: hypothetical protein GX847_03205 [Clostridiales bacterium]|nr:hypothetical protein [Clostridiales bacterium]